MPQPSCTTLLLFNAPVQPPETNPESPALSGGVDGDDYPGIAETFRHSGWARTRHLVYEALKATHQSVARIVAFSGCGAFAWVYRTLERPYRYRLGGSSCRDRFCLPCAHDRSRVLAGNVMLAIKDQPVRFVTLTLKHSPLRLGLQLDRIYDAFRLLRSRAFWKRHVKGGAAFLEVTYSAKTHSWHPHLHVLVHGTYIPGGELKNEWHHCTGDSYIVDVRFVRDTDKVAAYVAKYCSKPLNNTFLARENLLHEFIRAMKSRRLCLTFGDWRRMPLTASPSEFEWESMGSFHSVIVRAIEGEASPLLAIHAICGDRQREVYDAVSKARPPPPAPRAVEVQAIFMFPPTWMDN